MVDHDDDELAEAIRELTRTIDELRSELDDSRRRSPLRPPLPRPPSPGELLRLTDEVAVPALLAALEASIRTLEAFQRGLTIVRTEREVRDQVQGATDVTGAGDRASELRQTTLSQLDTVLAQLQRAVSEGSLPADEEARGLLTEARELRDDVDSRLRTAGSDHETDRDDESRTIEIEIDEPDSDDPDDALTEEDADQDSSVDVDVDAELETLKDQYSADDPTADSPAADDDPTTDSPAADDDQTANTPADDDDPTARASDDDETGDDTSDSTDDNDRENDDSGR